MPLVDFLVLAFFLLVVVLTSALSATDSLVLVFEVLRTALSTDLTSAEALGFLEAAVAAGRFLF